MKPTPERIQQIQNEIAEMFKIDQESRDNYLRGKPWDDSIDKKNTAKLKQIIKEIGFPSKSVVGKDAYGQMWFVIQHADHDVKFQKKCLKILKSLPESETHPLHIAFLEDRVRVNTDRPQLYGSQFYTDEDGKRGPRPIKDPEGLEERRKKMGLEPFKKYQERMEEMKKEYSK